VAHVEEETVLELERALQTLERRASGAHILLPMTNFEFAKSFGIGAIVALVVVGGVVFAQLSLAPNQRSSFNCQEITGSPYSIQGSGFTKSRSSQISSQFVIKPNSTAFLRISYYAPFDTAQDIYANRSKYFFPTQYWGKLGTNSILSDAEVGLAAAPVNVTVTGIHTLNATYEVTALASAQNGAYLGVFWNICGPQLVLTVGDSFYNGPGLDGIWN
jgi:hypothetical protein